MEVRQKSFFLKSPSGKHLAASAVWPSSGKVSGLLLVVPPLLEERKALLPPLTEFTRMVADELSVASLRIDFSGTGDSEGNLQEASFAEWTGELLFAADLLGRAAGEGSGPVPMALLGVRTGAMAALEASQKLAGSLSLLLWDPVTGGDSVKQWLQRRMVNDMIAYGKAKVSRTDLIASLESGGCVDLDGFAFPGALYSELEKAGYPKSFKLRTHVLATGRPLPSLQAWAGGNESVSLSELKLPPYWNSVGYIDTLPLQKASAAWLAEIFGSASASFNHGLFSSEEQAYFEIHVEILSEGKTVRGIYTCPEDSAPRRAVLFLGGWSGDRQGPHRLFTLYARRLAARGIASLRIDYLGRGESDLSHSETGIRLMAANGADALELLARESGLASADLVAICSGCKVAITIATLSRRVRDMVLLSAEAMGSLRSKGTNSRKTASALLSYLRKLTRPETWKKILTGRVNTSMVGKALASHETRSADEAASEDRTLSAFRKFRGAITFVYGGSDPDAAPSSAAYRRFCGRHGITSAFHTVPHAGHSYYGLDWTEELLAVADKALKVDGEDEDR